MVMVGFQYEVPHDEVRDYFRTLSREHQHASAPSKTHIVEQEQKQVHVLQLINAYRFRGHQQARINPLESQQSETLDELTLEYHKLNSSDLNTEFETGSLCGVNCATLGQIYQRLIKSYCGSIGAEYMHMLSTEEKRWLQQRIEVAGHGSVY